MPKREDLNTIILLGAGPIIIGQACEFDYSGTQACKALREEGYRVVLINSNPATIMTDPEMADATYLEPLTPGSVEAVIRRELDAHPEQKVALLPTMGGQVALNVSLALADSGFLDEQGIQTLGAGPDVVRKAEDRQLFRDAMQRIGIACAKSIQVDSVEAGKDALEHTGLPAILRPSFTLGGTGGGIANTLEEFETLIAAGLRASPAGTVLVEESLLGWKEFELEVVRDRTDNAIIICSIENIDPMGIHTGDSITVAPALTLTDKEYQEMRNSAIACVREIGVDTGGSNVQFAVNPANGRQVLIEMNPRVSRSSALASKATGFPIAKVAAKLAVGYTLDEITNEITGTTPASFEPTIDYVVTKIPRFDFAKFPQAQPVLTTSMKSVGEVMSIGRNFAQSVQKALRSLEIGLTGFDETPHGNDAEAIKAGLGTRSPLRLLLVAQALRAGIDERSIHDLTAIDPWFISRINQVVAAELAIHRQAADFPHDRHSLLAAKKLGLSDARIGALVGRAETDITAFRRSVGIEPVIKKIDTCAGEFKCMTSFMYSAYEGDGFRKPHCEADPSNRRKVAILGSGPNRIGQGIEFDYCCVHACQSLTEEGFETIMINCNPETVSTDYDTSDRLYFEPLTEEDVIEVLRKEQSSGELLGVIVQLGGQTPLKLSSAIMRAGIRVLGTSPDSIDLCEDRNRFKSLVEELGLRQPDNRVASSESEALECAAAVGYPLVIRPSYVLGGQAMRIVENETELKSYIAGAVEVSNDKPVLIDSYLRDAVECDVDAIGDDEDYLVCGVMEHVEPAGIHSGDSACVLPPYSLDESIVAEMKEQTVALATALGVSGLVNVQYAVRGRDIFLIEVNPRASRTVPFVAKATGVPFAKLAAKIAVGRKLKELPVPRKDLEFISVKEAVLPFNRFEGCDIVLGPEMKSTGEVMGTDTDINRAFAKAQEAAGFCLDRTGRVLIADLPQQAGPLIESLVELHGRGVEIAALPSPARRLEAEGLDFHALMEDPLGLLDPEDIRMIFNPGADGGDPDDLRSLRNFALRHRIPHYTTLRGCALAATAVVSGAERRLTRNSLQTIAG